MIEIDVARVFGNDRPEQAARQARKEVEMALSHARLPCHAQIPLERGNTTMIRMGRGNRTDEPTTTNYDPQPQTEPYRYNDTTSPAAIPSRGSAISESDSMARDIKE